MSADLVLAIETSCDETAVALADEQGRIIASEVASQIELHARYGGVVPELASRNHNADLRPLVERVVGPLGWGRIAAVAATSGPGLASSLLVGDTTAKAIAVARGIPFFSINHMEGHLLSPFVGSGGDIPGHLALVVSGGHTLLVEVEGIGRCRVIGSTKDDAAGEAFDKVGKMLGLPYPGGPEIARRAEAGNPKAFDFPRSMLDSGDHDFSFSGLKTSAFYLLRRLASEYGTGEGMLPDAVVDDVCASFEEAVVEILSTKLFDAAAQEGFRRTSLSGGVACNALLRRRISEQGERKGIICHLVDPAYSTDNAAMIAFAAVLRRRAGIAPSPLSSDIDPNLSLGTFR